MRARIPSESSSGAPLIAAWNASFCPRIRFSLVRSASSARACWTATPTFLPSDVKRSCLVDPPRGGMEENWRHLQDLGGGPRAGHLHRMAEGGGEEGFLPSALRDRNLGPRGTRYAWCSTKTYPESSPIPNEPLSRVPRRFAHLAPPYPAIQRKALGDQGRENLAGNPAESPDGLFSRAFRGPVRGRR